MTFRDWIGEQPTDYRNRNYVDDLELAYLAGQASAEQRVKELEQCLFQMQEAAKYLTQKNDDLSSLRFDLQMAAQKVQELERERDLYKTANEQKGRWIEEQVKAQEGEPDFYVRRRPSPGYEVVSSSDPMAQPAYLHSTTERRVIPEDVRKVMEMAMAALKQPLGFTSSREIDAILQSAITALRNALNAAPKGEV